MDEQARIERVRVPKFEWEKLLLISPLPFNTRAVGMMLSPYMSEDGGRVRPGLDNLVDVTARSRSFVIEHVGALERSGYLTQLERGGWRRGRSRASTYAATVPLQVFHRATELLHGSPWGRRSGEPDVRDEGPGSRTFVPVDSAHEGLDLPHEGLDLPHEGPGRRTPSISSINQETSTSGTRSAPPPDGRRAPRSKCVQCKGRGIYSTGVGMLERCPCTEEAA